MNIAPSKPNFVHILLVLMTMLAATFKDQTNNKKNVTIQDYFSRTVPMRKRVSD